MANSRKDLKAYVRLDASGRVVAGSLIFRKKAPRTGKWMQVPAAQCCDPLTVTETTTVG